MVVYLHVSLSFASAALNLLDGVVVVLLVDVHAHNVRSQGSILQRQLLSNSVSTASDQDRLVLHGHGLLALDRQVDALDEVVGELRKHHDQVHDQLQDLRHGNSIFLAGGGGGEEGDGKQYLGVNLSDVDRYFN